MHNHTRRLMNTVFAMLLLFFATCAKSPPSDHQESTISIASFNLLHLGWDNGKDLNTLARVIARYDVVALQEVMNLDTLQRLKSILDTLTGIRWNAIASSQKIGRTSYKEYYAIVFRSDRTTYVQQSASVWADSLDEFEREPFYASFRSGNFDYTLIVMHSDFDSRKEVMRREARALKNVFNVIQDLDPHENDLILVGDFNLCADDTGWVSLKGLPTMTHFIACSTLTTINARGNLTSSYDNIWIQASYTGREYSGTSGVDYYYTTLLKDEGQPARAARQKISDHLPVYALFITNKEDDD